jgi:hypothetical protein
VARKQVELVASRVQPRIGGTRSERRRTLSDPSLLATAGDRLPGLAAAKRRFREIFQGGFSDPTYLSWERDYKWAAHLSWERELGLSQFRGLIEAGNFEEIARRVARFYGRSKLNMLALYEWMALREALESPRGARLLTTALFDLLHGQGPFGQRLEVFTAALDLHPNGKRGSRSGPL